LSSRRIDHVAAALHSKLRVLVYKAAVVFGYLYSLPPVIDTLSNELHA
jgi:hypothetical protein